MNIKSVLCNVALVTLPSLCGAAPLTIQAVNSLPLARGSQTIEVLAADLVPLAAKNLNLIHIVDSTGKEVLCQAIDNDGDELHKFDAVIFQADFAANETKTFTATVGGKQTFTKDQYKAFGRFVRERFDDFVWENDRIAHRTYGKALETWKGEPLTSSTIDIWSKRTPKMIVNDWYLGDDYHVDHGDGADFYSAGATRGCGGNGVWAADKLWVSKNFTNSRVLANGPIRVVFELDYDGFEVNGSSVSETKRVSLDAGQNFDHFQSAYKTASGGADSIETAIGLKKTAGEQLEVNEARGWLAKWEPMEKKAGNQGLAVIVAPKAMVKKTEDALNQLIIAKMVDGRADYWAGFCWDKFGGITSLEGWKKQVDEFAHSISEPIKVTISAK